MPRNPTHTTDDSSDESDRDHDVHPRGMRDNDQGRRTESQEPTSQEYEAQIRAFKEQIALLRIDMTVHRERKPPFEPPTRIETPQG